MPSSIRGRCAAARPASSPIAIAAALALSVAGQTAHAVTYTWAGPANSYWSTNGSWQGNAAPPVDGLTTSDLVFGSTSGGGGNLSIINGNYGIRSLTFSAGANAYTFSNGVDSTFTLGAGGLAQNAANAQSFFAQVLLGADQLWTLASGSGALNFVQGLNTAGGGTARTLTINAATTTGSGNAINGVISGSGALTKLGSGILTLTGASTYTGTTTVGAGTLALANGARLASGIVKVNSGATLAISGSINSGASGSFSVDGNASSANLSATGSLATGNTAIGGASGSATFNHNNGTHTTGTLSLAGTNASSQGTYNLNGGTLTAGKITTGTGGGGGGGGPSTFNFNGGTLQAGASTTSFLQGLTAANVQTGGARIDSNGFDVSIAQSLRHDATSGAPAIDGGLTKLGAGTLTLTGASTYTGPTSVNAGTLAIVSGARITGGALGVNGGATLAISGSVSPIANGTLAVDGTTNLSGSASSLSTGAATVGSEGSGTFNHTGGSFTTNGDALFIGNLSDSSGTYNLSGSTSSLSTGTAAVGSQGSGTFNHTGGSFTTNGSTLLIGSVSGSSGTYNLSGSTSNLSTGPTLVGRSGSGTFNLSSGSFTTNGNDLYIGFGASGSGTLNLSGSSLSAGLVLVGNSGSGIVNQSGGSFTTSGNTLFLAFGPNSSGTYNLSGGSLTTGRTQVSNNSSTGLFRQSGGTHTSTTLTLSVNRASSQGTYSLDGGTLIAGTITSGDDGFGSGISTFNFNGGTLQARAANGSFLQDLTTANVQAGGARVDTNGFNVTIGQALVHDTTAGAAAIDGGLTKLGAGTLTLEGANTFTGALNIAAGTLAVAAESRLGSRNDITVGGGGSLLFTGSTTLTRTYNLGVSTLAIGGGNTLTLGSSAVISGGFLGGPGTTALGSGSTLNGVTAFAGSTLAQTSGAATINGSTIRGTLAQTGGTLAANNVFITSSGRVSVGGTVNTTGTEIFGVTTIDSGGLLANSGSSLYLSGGSRTAINSGGTLSTATGTTIELNGSQLVNNGRQSGVLDINFGSLAKGSGSFGTINIADGGKFSPGNSPGTATAENFTFGAGGRYDFELNTANPRFGIDSDLLVVTDTLFVTAGTTPNSVFTIGVVSLNQANQPAALSDFDSSRSYHYLLVDANNVSGFASAKFNVDTSGFYNSLNGGRFSVSLSGNDVYLDFVPMPVPEPATWAMWLAAAAMGAGLQSRRRQWSQR